MTTRRATAKAKYRGPSATPQDDGVLERCVSRCDVAGDAADDGAEHFGVEGLLWGGFGEVAVEDDEVGEVAGGELAFDLLAPLGEGGALCVGVEGFVEGEFFLRLEGLGSGFVHARDGGVKSAHGVDGLDWIVGAEGERDSVREERAP